MLNTRFSILVVASDLQVSSTTSKPSFVKPKALSTFFSHLSSAQAGRFLRNETLSYVSSAPSTGLILHALTCDAQQWRIYLSDPDKKAIWTAFPSWNLLNKGAYPLCTELNWTVLWLGEPLQMYVRYMYIMCRVVAHVFKNSNINYMVGVLSDWQLGGVVYCDMIYGINVGMAFFWYTSLWQQDAHSCSLFALFLQNETTLIVCSIRPSY